VTEPVEMIGKVRLNKQWYQGNDQYSDGDEIENRLLAIVRNHSDEDYNSIIMHEGSWPLLYHLSPIRENIIAWYPFRKGARVLELGAGCGAVTGALLNRGLQVTAVDLSLRRSRINATRHSDCEELVIYVGSIEEVLKSFDQHFDYVLLIGVLEYVSVFNNISDPQKHMLNCIKDVMEPDAELFVAIENKIGLKYLSGAREDHTGRFFEGIEGYPHRDGPRTFCKNELESLFESCGFTYDFFYPYPDYKFPMKIFSDERKPVPGELNRNWQTFDANRILLFNEDLASDVMIGAGLMDDLANSFLVRLTMKYATARERILFVKSSTERLPAYRHHTTIMEHAGEVIVEKRPASKSAEAHLHHMQNCRKQLIEGLKPDARVSIAPCYEEANGSVYFPYYTQKTMCNQLSALRGNAAQFCGAIERFKATLCMSFGTVPFVKTEGFKTIFGNVDLEDGLECLGVTNLDLNFDNVFIDVDGYIIVDYEWVVPFPVPLTFMLYRALLVNVDMALFSDEERALIWMKLGISEKMREIYFEMELCFQSYVSGEYNKLENFHNREFKNSFEPLSLEDLINMNEELTRQRDEYHRVNDELWRRVEIAERNLVEATTELNRIMPIWRKVLKRISKR